MYSTVYETWRVLVHRVPHGWKWQRSDHGKYTKMCLKNHVRNLKHQRLRCRNTFSSAVTSASVECELPAGYTSEQLLLGPYKQEVLEHANAANRSASANWDFIEQDPALWRVDIEEAEETTKNPRNDYSANYVETGEFPQNKVRDAGYARRFEEYPKLRELIRLKDELVAQTSTYAYWAPLDLARRFVAPGDGHSLFGGFKFDVIVVEPPLAEYEMTNRVRFDRTWTWDAVCAFYTGVILPPFFPPNSSRNLLSIV